MLRMRHTTLVTSVAACWAAFVAAALSQAAAAEQSGKALPMIVRTFVCDVTPPMGSPLCAGRIKDVVAVDEPLLAKGVILEDAGGKYVLCALDWCLLRGGAYDAFRDRIAEAVGTTPARVAVQCVHQHNAPNTDPRAQDLLAKAKDAPVHADNAYLIASAEKVAAAAKAAANARSVSHVGTSRAMVEKVASNRRVPMPDGTIGVRYSATKDPVLRAAPEGLIDPWLKTITLFDGDKPLVQMHYYATHPQSHYGDGRVTYDFPGIARERLEKETGVFQMYFTGCAGNITAGKYNEGKPEQRTELAERLYAAMRQSIAGIDHRPVQAIDWRVRPVRLPRRTEAKYEDKALRTALADPAAPAGERINAALALASFERMNTNRPIDFTCMSIGRVHVLHLPGEPFIQYQLLAQKTRPDDFVAVAGYGDDFTGYICNEKAYAEGGYEPTSTVLSPLGEYYMTAAITDLMSKQQAAAPRLLGVTRIWNAAPHCAFTDLVRYKDRWFCAFREGPKHVSDEASIRVIRSTDGEKWESAALLSEAGADLRDAKLSITPDNRLMLLGGRRTWPPKYERSLGSWVAFSDNGADWSDRQRVCGDDEWLWRVTWHDGLGYGIGYGSATPDKNGTDWTARLYRTSDGLEFRRIASFGEFPGLTEATIRFGGDGTAFCIQRRDGGTRTALLGTAVPPYTDWKWRDTGFHFGGPDLIDVAGTWYAGGRWVIGAAKTVLARVNFDRGTIEPVLELPSGGDTSYPAFVFHEGKLWMSYYSSHEGTTAIYLARIQLP